MRQRLLEARRREGGFTLIELLIVIVILGVLAAVVVIAVGAFDDRGEQAACQSDKRAVEVAVEAFRVAEQRYPDTLAELEPDYLRELPPGAADDSPYWIDYTSSTGEVKGLLRGDGPDGDTEC